MKSSNLSDKNALAFGSTIVYAIASFFVICFNFQNNIMNNI
jgi:hypothetical protein